MPDAKKTIKAPHQRIDSGVRYQDLLADAFYPAPQIISQAARGLGIPLVDMGEEREAYERALRRSWGEAPDDVQIKKDLADDEFLNRVEATPIIGDIIQTITHSPLRFAETNQYGDPKKSRARRAFKPLALKYGDSLAKMVFRAGSLPAAFGGSLFDPAAKALGTWYGSRGIEGGTITPGGNPEAHRRAREERRRKAEELARLAEEREIARLRGPSYYALGRSEE